MPACAACCPSTCVYACACASVRLSVWLSVWFSGCGLGGWVGGWLCVGECRVASVALNELSVLGRVSAARALGYALSTGHMWLGAVGGRLLVGLSALILRLVADSDGRGPVGAGLGWEAHRSQGPTASSRTHDLRQLPVLRRASPPTHTTTTPPSHPPHAHIIITTTTAPLPQANMQLGMHRVHPRQASVPPTADGESHKRHPSPDSGRH